MKRVVVLLLLICSLATSFAQPIINRTFGTNTVSDPRLKVPLNFFPPQYADTTAANLQKGVDSCGAVIYTYNVDGFWYRQCFPKKWVRFSAGSSGVQSVTGTAVNITDPINPIINLQRFGAEDNSSTVDRGMNMNQHVFNINGATGIYIGAMDIGAGGVESALNLAANNSSITQTDNAYLLRYKFVPAFKRQGDYFAPLSVNGNVADSTGDISISGDGAGLLHVVAGTKLSQVNDSTIKLADSVWQNIYDRLSEKLTQATADGLYSALGHTHSFASLTSKPTTIAGYGITDPIVLTSGSYSNPSWITALAWSKITVTPTTITGYGITDAFTQANADALYSVLAHTHTFASLTSKPTTLSGYGITDAYPLSGNPSNFLTANQSITLSGDISGSGSTAITTTIGAGKVTNAMLAGSIDLTSKVTGLLPDANISSASTWSGKQTALSGTGLLSFSGTTPSYNTTSSSISGIISDETGSGAMVFGTTPTFTTSVINKKYIGGTAANDTISFQGNNATGNTAANVNMKFNVGNNGGLSAMTILNNGKVGIGTTAPSQNLDVIGTIRIGANAPYQRYFQFTNAANNTEYFSIDSKSDGSPIFNTQGRAGFYLNNGTTDVFTVLLNGNVGVGASPNAAALLDLTSTTKALKLMSMTKTQRDAISSPPAGSMIYQNDNTPGLRVYNGTNWMRFTETAD